GRRHRHDGTDQPRDPTHYRGRLLRAVTPCPAQVSRPEWAKSRSVTIKTAGGSAAIGSLSGGNQQKVVIGKMLTTDPKVILLDEPSRGIDIGAKAEVFRLLSERAKRGLAVVFTTSEVAECLSIAHRIIVMHRGRISAQFGSDVEKEKIMAASGEAVVA
ncbi:MAG: ATP-binding cassette domain-containing protein, partial [Pseudomonadota bacterium]|nr:ATP-binding cassette domain-containing protein [Pseudomonadota bacterium]